MPAHSGSAVDQVRQQRRRAEARALTHAPSFEQRVEHDEQRQRGEPEQRDWQGEAHFALRRKRASGLSHGPDVVRTTCRTPSEASIRESPRRSSTAASAKRRRSFAQFLLAGIADLDRDHVVTSGELEQRPSPVDGASEVRCDHDERSLPREHARPAHRFAERGRTDALVAAFVPAPEIGEEVDQPEPSAAQVDHARIGVPERHGAEAVAASRCQVADRDRDAFRDVGLAAIGGAEAHRRRRVEHQPRREHALSVVHAHVRLACASGGAPVDPPNVVARLVGSDLRELGAVAVPRRAIVAAEKAVHPPADCHVECVEEPGGNGPRAGTLGRASLGEDASDAQAALVFVRSRRGSGTAAITPSRMLSGLTSSARPW